MGILKKKTTRANMMSRNVKRRPVTLRIVAHVHLCVSVLHATTMILLVNLALGSKDVLKFISLN